MSAFHEISKKKKKKISCLRGNKAEWEWPHSYQPKHSIWQHIMQRGQTEESRDLVQTTLRSDLFNYLNVVLC